MKTNKAAADHTQPMGLFWKTKSPRFHIILLWLRVGEYFEIYQLTWPSRTMRESSILNCHHLKTWRLHG